MASFQSAFTRGLVALLPLFSIACATTADARPANVPPNDTPIRIEVDAREAAIRLLHAKLTIPVKPGPVTLLYPKWIPGEHGPTGPLVNLSGLHISAGGAPVPWRRDDLDMYAIHVDVPAGQSALLVSLDFLPTGAQDGFSAGASSTPELVDVSWNQILLYPAGRDARAWTYSASIKLPPGWKWASALSRSGGADDAPAFQPVTLERLVDSPLVAGAHMRTVDLGNVDGRPHAIQLVADSDAALEMTDAQQTSYHALVREAGALFGARHYASYQFLFTLSDHVASFGLEHHESSDDREGERALVDDSRRKAWAGLLPHEYVHSWNGKFRRPSGLATRDYQDPMKGELLWVYEGLTEYLGEVLTARSGLWTDADYREALASTAAYMDHAGGRGWRPLEDTAVEAQILYNAPGEWALARRDVDFYAEGTLLWLEVDTTIRRLTQNKKSIDDFCRVFYGGGTGGPEVKPYTFDDVVNALGEVVKYDWRSLLRARVSSTDPRAPLGGITESGYRLVYDEKASDMIKARSGIRHLSQFMYSLGFNVRDDGTISDVAPGLPALVSGIGPGMKLMGVNGRKYSSDVLHDAIKAAKDPHVKIELLFEVGEFYRTFVLDYHGGDRYPHLERDTGKPDLLDAILAPRIPRPAAQPAAATK